MAPDIYMSGLQHQMVSSMGRDLWRSQPWTVSSVVGPVTTLLQAEQMGMGSGPGRAREPEEDVESKPALYLLSKEEQWKTPLGQVPWNRLGWFVW